MEGTDFAPAQPCGELQQKKFKTAVLFGLDQQPLDLFRGQHLHLLGLGGREAAAIGRVAEKELFRNRLIQCGMEGGVDAPDSLVGETFTIEVSSEKSAALFEPGVELLNIVGGQLVQLGAAQCGDDVLIDAPLIRHLGVGAKVGLLVTLIPKIQPIAQ